MIDTRPNVVTKLYNLILTDTTDKLRHHFYLYDVYLLAFDTIIYLCKHHLRYSKTDRIAKCSILKIRKKEDSLSNTMCVVKINSTVLDKSLSKTWPHSIMSKFYPYILSIEASFYIYDKPLTEKMWCLACVRWICG